VKRRRIAKWADLVDRVRVPRDNPWRRNIRIADITFRTDGLGYAVTFVGDVWSVAGLAGELKEVRWRRFASGLHQPPSMGSVNESVGLLDTLGNTALHELLVPFF